MTKPFVVYLILLISLLVPTICNAQKLKQGFFKDEYMEMLRVSALQIDTPWTYKSVPPPLHSTHIYRSKVMGLRNMWDLWMYDSIAVISLRGTVSDPVSWLENYYCGMVKANGNLQISNDYNFKYHLASDAKAAIHLGWLIGLAVLAPDVLSKLDSLNKNGISQCIIIGHSQGGAIGYLLHAHLLHLQHTNMLPSNWQFKSYCSAAPKPGNLYFAHSFENATAGGWSFTVVNSADWVPEVPLSIQNIDDITSLSPFANAKQTLHKLSFPKNLAASAIYNRFTNPTEKLRNRYMKVVDKHLFKAVRKELPQFVKPTLYKRINYQRCGVPIVLLPDTDYNNMFKDTAHVFTHHFIEPYIYLTQKLNMQ
jgi:hypothetical protein